MSDTVDIPTELLTEMKTTDALREEIERLRALLLRLAAAVCDLLVQSPVTDRETRREIEGLIEEVRKSANADPS